MSRKYTGIEIGTREVKMTQCMDNRLYRMAAEPLPENYVKNGRIVSMDAMSTFLREMAKKHRFQDKSCALVLPGSAAFSRRMTMPAMTIDQLKINLPYEFRDFINDRKEEYLFDYSLLEMIYDEEMKPVTMDLMAAAAPKGLMEDYKQMIRQAGFKLEIGAPEEFAYSNLIRAYENREDMELCREYCFVDLGYTTTKLHIFTGSRFEITREIEYGCGSLVQAVANAQNVDPHVAQSYVRENHMDVWQLESCKNIYSMIGIELMRALNFYGFNNPDSQIQTVYYCGGGAGIPPFTETITEQIGLEPRPIAELITMAEDLKEELIISPAAVGITYQ